MNSKRSTRCGVAFVIFAAVLATSARIQAADQVERITATTVAGTTARAEGITIELIRWSTDAERTQFLPALSGKPVIPSDARALARAVSIGYVWGEGAIGYAVRYAERQSIAGGGDRIVLVVARDFGSWQGKPDRIVPPPPNREPEPPPIPGRERPYVKLLLEIGDDAYEGIKFEHETGMSNEILAKRYDVTVTQVEQVIKLESEAKAAADAEAARRAFETPVDRSPLSVVELRLTGAIPQGKVAAATNIAANISNGLMLRDTPAAEVVQLKGIKRGNEPAATATRTPAAAAPKAGAPATTTAAPKRPAK